MLRFFIAVNVLVVCGLLYRFNGAISSGEVWFLFRILMFIVASAIAAGLYSYVKHFRKTSLFLVHGILFLLLTCLSLVHLIDYFLGQEVLAPSRSLLIRSVYLQILATLFLTVPATAERLSGRRSQGPSPVKWHAEIIVLYAFSAIYPVQHYILNNVDAFSLGLSVQFTLIACLVPALTFFVL